MLIQLLFAANEKGVNLVVLMQQKLNYTATFFCLILLTFVHHAQQAKQYAFRRFETEHGLSSSIVNNVVQDRDGYIWIATINGLQRYDGNKFLTFRNVVNNPSTIPNDDVVNVYKDSQENLWVQTVDNKVGIFNTSTFLYKEVPVPRSDKPDLYISKRFLETDDGKLFLHITTDAYLYRYDAVSKTFLVDRKTLPFPPNWKINYIHQDKATKKMWMTSDSGLAVYNPGTKALSYVGNNVEQEPLLEQYKDAKFLHYLYIIADQRLFFEEWPASIDHPVLHVFHLKTGEKKQHDLKKSLGFGYHEIKSVLEQEDGRLWIFGLAFIAEYTNGANPFQLISNGFQYENSIRFNNVHSMYEDKEENIWVCTENGLFLFNPGAHFFDNYYLARTDDKAPVNGRVQVATQLNNRQIWIGTRDLGLYVYSPEFKPLPLPASIIPYQKKMSIWDIHQHSKTGLVWLGMRGGNIIVYDPKSNRSRHLTSPYFGGRAITQIAEDNRGNLWFGTQGGAIVKWNYKTSVGTNDRFELIFKTKTIRKLYADSRGGLWAATVGDGLLQFDQGSGKKLAAITQGNPADYRLWNNAPTDILQYNDSTLLVVSGAINFINLKTKKIKHVSTQNGLPSNTVLTCIRDKEGICWLGLANGLCRANIEKGFYTVYTRNDGIWDDNFNIAEGLSLPDGRLLFSSEKSFLVFNPTAKRRAHAAPMPYITDFRLNNRPLNLDSLTQVGIIDLDYDQNMLAVQFSALSYHPQTKLSYYYKLENLDKEWVKADGSHQAIFSYIPPGKYPFKIKVENEEGVFGNERTAFIIDIAPPFWKTWWFFGLMVLFLACTVYYMDRERMMRLKATQKVRTEIAYQLHEDVNTTLNNINVLSQIAKIKADKNIEKSKEFIEQIGEKSHNMAIAMDDMLWSIDPGNDNMEKTLVRIFEFADALKNRHQSIIHIDLDDNVRSLQLDMKARYEFLLICKEALRNFVQYATTAQVFVHLACIKSTIILKVQADEIAVIDNEKILQSKREMYRRAALIGANLEYNFKNENPMMMLSLPTKKGVLQPSGKG